jgi:hypothetical protein
VELTADQRAQLIASFRYEVAGLVGQGMLYLRHGHRIMLDPELSPAADALLEALLIRLRSLDSFFDNQRKWTTDAIGADLTSWEGRSTLVADAGAVNKRVAHLTYERPEVHEWPIGVMVRAALEAARDFIDACPTDARAAWADVRDEVVTALDNWGDLDNVWTWPNHHACRRP